MSDSLGLIVDAMQKTIQHLGLEPRSEQALQHVIGLGLKEAMDHLYPSIAPSVVNALIEQYRTNYINTTQQVADLFPGVENLMIELHRQGYLLAIATGKGRRGLTRSLTQSGIQELFHASVCADEAFSKPHPRMIEIIMNELGVSREQTLMIGDTGHDLQMAINAGVDCIAVNYGAHDEEDLLEFNPLKCFNNLDELPDWLSNEVHHQEEPDSND